MGRELGGGQVVAGLCRWSPVCAGGRRCGDSVRRGTLVNGPDEQVGHAVDLAERLPRAGDNALAELGRRLLGEGERDDGARLEGTRPSGCQQMTTRRRTTSVLREAAQAMSWRLRPVMLDGSTLLGGDYAGSRRDALFSSDRLQRPARRSEWSAWTGDAPGGRGDYCCSRL